MTEELNALIPAEFLAPAIAPDEFKTEIQSGDYLPRIQIADSNSKLVKKNIVATGNWALVRSADDADDLTNEVNVLVINCRWKALDLMGEKPVSDYDKGSDFFKAIVERSKTPNSKCMWGPEFLIWLPEYDQYATYFCSSKTARRESDAIYALLGKAATIKTHLIETKDYAWYGPVCMPCATPFEIPPLEQLKEQAVKFSNPATVEKAKDDGRER